MTANPSKLGSPQTLARLLASSPAEAARHALALVGRETLWAADIFARLTVSVLVLRAVSRLTAEWFFPKEIWNQSDQILKGFAGEDEAPPVGERPRLIHEQAGWKFYQHRTIYNGQLWPCALLKPEPCAQCEWFVPADDGRNWCAAVAKVRTLHNDHFRDMDLYDLRDELVRTYGDRRRRNDTGPADPSRPGCL
jgi:hypothetical protein